MESRSEPAATPQPPPARIRPTGGLVERGGETWYRIAAHHRLRPFLMSLPTDTDLWMFVTSRGGLTAGRVDPDGSLFPYLTSDRLHDAHHHTGPLTLVRAETDAGEVCVWEPFAAANDENPAIERNLDKHVLGNALVFEEIDHALGLAFRYEWAGCDAFGWVRRATLENRGDAPVRLAVLDGLRNLMPWGVPLALDQQASNLADAYKKTEVDPETGLGIVALTAGITDRAEAREVLRATTVWNRGLPDARVHLSLDAVADFRAGRVLAADTVRNGGRGHYLVSSHLALEPGAAATWVLAADTGRDHVQVAALRRRLRDGGYLRADVDAELRRSRRALRGLIASADGLQRTGRDEAWSHHLANVLYNILRGGVFWRNHDIPRDDLADVLATRNRPVAERHRERIAAWPDAIDVDTLQADVRESGDPDLRRLALESLPLHFGRRHGDPSRPWNRFAIRVRDRDGDRVLHHQGNWRDIFQNWEALATAFPAFLPAMVARFVNASTVDGFNPYRISRDGIDWEVPEPDDPWSNIGYWGDHQVIYLLKLLESLHQHDPHALGGMLGDAVYSYADVPYTLKPYAEILADPAATIVYDEERAARIARREAARGTDGRLVADDDGEVLHVTLLEKLLVPALAKLSNLVPGGGIWMNTQRPEWNDANNALARGGVSVVTLAYLRRYLAFLAERLEAADPTPTPVSQAVVAWFERVAATYAAAPPDLDGPDADRRRKEIMDTLGEAFGDHRANAYAHGPGDPRELSPQRVAAFFRDALAWADHGLAANRRPDGLYHTYNLLVLDPARTTAGLARLPEMLEGQVAVLSSGAVDPHEALAMLERLFASDLYRADQHSFLLYPEHDRPGFLQRNQVPADRVAAIPLLGALLAAGDRALLAVDTDGVHRFHGDLTCAADVADVLDTLAADPTWSDQVARDRDDVLALFDEVFGHRSYTGRSGVMYGYEGIGCIYWHMVAKLLLAVQEVALQAEQAGAAETTCGALQRMYLRVRSGLGHEKPVTEYGAFPTDPYSHTPPDGGARQPGMTGQVKEEILTRRGELGVRVDGGTLGFRPTLLQAHEFCDRPTTFTHVDVAGDEQTLDLPAGSLAFTVCQVPVVYRHGAECGPIVATLADGTSRTIAGTTLPVDLGHAVFARNGWVVRLQVTVAVAAEEGA